jgi:tetratricopeptide (TPR) repeat protein
MDQLTHEAVEAVKVAMLLAQRYREDAASLATDTAVSLDERLLSLDQNYQGVWEQLDRAAAVLEQAGHPMTAFHEVRAQVRDAHQGYKQRDELRVSAAGIELKTTYRVNQLRLQHIRQALQALHVALPDQSFILEQDVEVEQFLTSQHSARRFLKPLIGLLVLLAAVAIILLAFQWMRPPDYGPDSKKIYALQDELEQQPCDKQKILALVETLNQAKAHKAALSRAAAFFARCGEYRRLRWATYAAYKRLGDWQGAAREATRLVEAVPRDRDYRWWRGEARERAGDLEGAIEDYRQAVALEPFLQNIPLSLADLLRQAGRPCEGIHWLANLAHHHPEQRQALMGRVGMLWNLPACSKLRGAGGVAIPLGEGGAPPMAPVAINGAAPRELLLDPDVLYVMLSSQLAAAVGVKADKGSELLIRTARGFFPTRLTRAARIRVVGGQGEASAPEVPLVVGDKLPDGAIGIVGQSFFSRFVVSSGGEPPMLRLAPVAQP